MSGLLNTGDGSTEHDSPSGIVTMPCFGEEDARLLGPLLIGAAHRFFRRRMVVVVRVEQTAAPVVRAPGVFCERAHLGIEALVLGLAHFAQRSGIEIERLAFLQLA